MSVSHKVIKCRQLTQTSTDGVQQCLLYQKYFCELQEMFVADVLVFNFVKLRKYPTNDRTMPAISQEYATNQSQVIISGQIMSGSSH